MTRLSRLAAFTLAYFAVLAGCDSLGPPPTAPPNPGGGPQTRVVRLTLDPDTVAVGDTTLIHVVITDSLDTRFRYLWGMQESTMLPVDGRLDGPRIRFIAPRTSNEPGRVSSAGASVRITNDTPGTRSVVYSFSIPILN
ncbi:hypothetical protein [Rubricoccus marinus]|uniref:Uncharacterized protein n=1 Tax=Rubricoccus marinus TaxID=716817 RepID=A0A259TV40_9BACT|nr:hypothetical protein [Rubricoccus marinus]OZC01444.1 hypothetical protein BSZ36_17355 [Rubricoccus marinus]